MTDSSEDGATPSKVRKEMEAGNTETTASTGPSEAALKTARFEQYDKGSPCQNPWSSRGRGGHPGGFRLFTQLSTEAGSRRNSSSGGYR